VVRVGHEQDAAGEVIDLNLVAAGLAATPETSPHTSVHQRVEHAAAQGKLDDLKAAACSSVAGSRAAGALEEDLWLCPIEDRSRDGGLREGMLEGFLLGSYFSADSARLRQLAQQRGVHHLDNLAGSTA
jgi:hypothetical protein